MNISLSTPTHSVISASDLGIARATISLAKAYDAQRFTYESDGRIATVGNRPGENRIVVIKKPATNGPD